MGHTTTRVSVVIPAFNAAATLPETLESALNQMRKPDEIIVVDDGSTDETSAIAASYDVTVVRKANAGVSAARNAGVDLAFGDLIALLDADDVWQPEKLARQVRFMDDRPEVGLTFTDFYESDTAGERLPSPSITTRYNYREITKTPVGDGSYILDRDAISGRYPKWSFIQPSTVVLKKQVYQQAEGFDTNLSLAEDFDFFCRLFALTEVGVIEAPLATYRRYEGQASSKQSALLRSELELAIAASLGTKPYHAVTNKFFKDELPSIAKRIGWSLFRAGDYAEAASVWQTVTRLEPSLRNRLLSMISSSGTVPIGSKTIGAAMSCGRTFKGLRRLTRRSAS